jgi:3-oxoadipate enol-lactonase
VPAGPPRHRGVSGVATVERPDGVRLHVETHGPDSPWPLVLLEGLGGDIPGWRRSIPRLSERRRVIAYDFRGNGRSDKPDRPMTMGTLVEDTVAVLDSMGVDRAHLYGQSLGGMVALELALTAPERVRSLVLGATHAGRARAARVPPELEKAPKGKPFLALYAPDFARDHPDHVAEDLITGSRNPQPAHARQRQAEAVADWDAWDRVAGIDVPVMVLHGTSDRLVSVENGRRLAALIPGAELVLLVGGGHVYHSERAEESDGAVLAFLHRVEAGP